MLPIMDVSRWQERNRLGQSQGKRSCLWCDAEDKANAEEITQ